MPPIDLPGRLAYSPAEAAALLGLGESTVRDLCARGELPAFRVLGPNSRLLIPRRALCWWLDRRATEHLAGAMAREYARWLVEVEAAREPLPPAMAAD